jgi:hypothetical protein
MSTLIQIESAVATLPPNEQWSLLTWLQAKLTTASKLQAATPEALKMFRQLQAEVGLTAEAASAWKAAVADARR